MKPIYFDNAATSWPKPPAMIEAMVRFNESIGANPGRSGIVFRSMPLGSSMRRASVRQRYSARRTRFPSC